MSRLWMSVPTAVLLGLYVSAAFAECNCGATTTTYVPAAVSYSASYTPTVTYRAPESYVAYSEPVTPYASYYSPSVQPYVAYSAPATTYVSYYAPATVPYTVYAAPPAVPYATYYAPTVRQPYVAQYGVPGASIYGTGKVYVPGQPVRNFVRAVTP